MKADLILPFDERYEEYLGDESKLKGHADSISFPRTKEEVAFVIRQMVERSVPVTIQGGKTGICGGAVPLGGHILNLSFMNKPLSLRKTDEGYYITVQAGMTLSELKKQLSDLSLDKNGCDAESSKALSLMRDEGRTFWPPEPTETSATVGGVLATNAQGICSALYGDSRQYVKSITIIDGSGVELFIQRGEHRVKDGCCRLPDGRLLNVVHSAFDLPNDSDVLDLFLGSEGMYGVIVEATLRLITLPKEMWGIAFFFEDQEGLFRFAEEINKTTLIENSAALAAAEYIDRLTLDNIQQLKNVATKLKGLPDIDESVVGMVYIELHGSEEADVEHIAERLMELAIQCGSSEETWALSGWDGIEKLRAFRHAAPESINIAVAKANQTDARILKLSTDITHRNRRFGDVVRMYQRDAQEKELQIAIFGHITGSHVHANILARNYGEYETGKALIAAWAAQAAAENGVVFSEHGVGKLKKHLFSTVDQTVFTSLHAIKKAMDEKGILNRGNIPTDERTPF